MKFAKIIILFVLCIFIRQSAFGQFTCAADSIQQNMLRSHVEFAALTVKHNSDWAHYSQLIQSSRIVNTANGPIYQIPVVIHVMHTGGPVGSPYNPADTVLTRMTDYLNAVYADVYAGYPDTNSGGVYLPIQFVMAHRDPACDSTTGIIRVNANSVPGYTSLGLNFTGTGGANDFALKALSIWPYDYYNIWIVNKIDGADGSGTGSYTAGYAFTPPAPSSQDGTVMLARVAVAGNTTIPHETGHFLGLLHTFYGGTLSACPSNVNCSTDGDMICDTEPEKQSNFNCPVDPNPCTGSSYNNVQHNFMDYSSCQNRFTAGQKTKIMFTLLSDRSGLISSLGGSYPDGSLPVAASCTPGINFVNNGADMGPHKVTLQDLSFVSNGYTFDGHQAYLDKTCTQVAHLDSTNTYLISVTTGPASIENVRAWIDYNNDGVFSASEMVLSHFGTVVNETHTGAFTIPATGVVRCTPLRMRVMSDNHASTLPTPCANLDYGQTEDYTVFIGSVPSTTISLTTGINPGCTDSLLSFTATAINLGGTPIFKWLVNGSTQAPSGNTFTSNTLHDGDSLSVKVFGVGCTANDSATSASVKIHVSPVPTAAFSASKSTFCPGDSSLLSAVTTTATSYQWMLNSAFITGANSAAYFAKSAGTYSLTVSNGGCAKTSTSSTLSLNAPPTAAISASATVICAGDSALFTATVGAGSTIQWLLNGLPIAGATHATYTARTLGSYSFIASNGLCTANSSGIVLTINPNPVVTISASKTTFCADDTALITATATSGVSYKWQNNGINILGGNAATVIANTQGVYRVVVTTPLGCSSTSTGITINTLPLPVPVITAAGAALSTGTFISYQWNLNGIPISGATNNSIVASNVGKYTVTVTDPNGCKGTSAIYNYIPGGVSNISAIAAGIKIYPDPATLVVYINSPVKINASLLTIDGQVIITKDAASELDISGLAKGCYIIRISDSQGTLLKIERIIKM